jgi:hypothetical protein
MQHKEADCGTIGAACSAGISGRVTADEANLGLRISKKEAFRRFIRGLLLATAVGVLPLQQATAGDTRAFLPTGFLDVSTLASNGDQNPYGVAFVPHGFPSGGRSAQAISWYQTSITLAPRQAAISKELEPRLQECRPLAKLPLSSKEFSCPRPMAA